MPNDNPAGCSGRREMATVVARLLSLYELGAGAANEGGETLREADPAWCIGETLAACGGYDLMWLVFRMIEDDHGLAKARWLDRSWNGVAIQDVVLWRAGHSPVSDG